MMSSQSFKAYAVYAFIFAGHLLSVSGNVLVSRRTSTLGCSKPHIVDGVSRDYQISTNGGNRTYRLHLPSSYDPDIPAPLVISYHGHGQDMVPQETLSQFSNDAINPSMIAVYPQGLKGAKGKRSWEGEFDPAPGVQDKLFTSDLINHLKDNYCIDTSRIYANGMSDGGGFTNTLACSSIYGAPFAAFAPVSGAFYTDTNYSDCTPSRSPLPILEFHGYADNTIKYNGGSGNAGPLPSIPNWLSWWARRDGLITTFPTLCVTTTSLISATSGRILPSLFRPSMRHLLSFVFSTLITNLRRSLCMRSVSDHFEGWERKTNQFHGFRCFPFLEVLFHGNVHCPLRRTWFRSLHRIILDLSIQGSHLTIEDHWPPFWIFYELNIVVFQLGHARQRWLMLSVVKYQTKWQQEDN